MLELITQSTQPIALPVPRVAITIRPGTLADVPFMDALQKKTTQQVGWMPTKQFEGKIAAGHVLVAEERREVEGVRREGENNALTPHAYPLTPSPIGYLIGNDQYFKPDDVGIIYQINVLPEFRRSLVAATLLKAKFERSAWGCRLYCCWCAQDIAANHFWESMGFVALAFRTGSRTKGKSGTARTHIFWQKRIRRGDASTPWWFPSKTDGGAIREDRLVLPIPPGVRWDEAMPEILPGVDRRLEDGSSADESALGDRRLAMPVRQSRAKKRSGAEPAIVKPAVDDHKPAARVQLVGMRFAPPRPEPTPVIEKPKRQKRQKAKSDPRHVAAARELRDRYLDAVNTGQHVIEPAVKYAIEREAGKRMGAGLLEAA